MGVDIDLQNKVGDVLPGQRWCELHGCFTIEELSKIILKINSSYKEPEDNANKKLR